MSETTWISVQERMNGRTHVKIYNENLVEEELEVESELINPHTWVAHRMPNMSFNGLINFPIRGEEFYASYAGFCRQYNAL